MHRPQAAAAILCEQLQDDATRAGIYPQRARGTAVCLDLRLSN